MISINNFSKTAKKYGGIQMAKSKNLFLSLLIAAFISGTMFMTGCGGGVSEEQMQQLNDLRAEVESLQSQVNAKQDEKSQLERQIADKDAKIKQYLNDIAAVQKRCP
jgi:septal ring factor EnvC (AmiA/AmiB activator)